MDMDRIKKASTRYALQVLIVANVVMLACYLVQYLAHQGTALMAPAAIGYTFHLATACLFTVIWRRVATSNPEMLTSVYMATSGFRMLLALATLTIVYFIVGREQMMPYALVFMAFYLVAVGHHSYFFARFNNKN